MFVDSHVHIDGPEFDADRDEVIERARAAGVTTLLNVGTGNPHSGVLERAIDLARKHPAIYTALAMGSNYNVQADGPSLLTAYANLQKAIELAPKASEHDRAYIEALAKRYSSDLQADRQKLGVDYKNAMGELAKRYPDDLYRA